MKQPRIALVTRHSSPQEIKALQAQLNAAGANIQVDGKIRRGGETENAIRVFQRKNGLIVDGKAGDATRSALAEQTINRIPLATAEGAPQLTAPDPAPADGQDAFAGNPLHQVPTTAVPGDNGIRFPSQADLQVRTPVANVQTERLRPPPDDQTPQAAVDPRIVKALGAMLMRGSA